MIRPSNSGKATFMAVSSGFKPRLLTSHCQRAWPEGIACNTGTSRTDRAEPGPWAVAPLSWQPIAKEIVVTRASQSGLPVPGSTSKSKAAGQPRSGADGWHCAEFRFRDVVKTASALAPRPSISRIIASTNARLPLIQ